MPSTTLPVYLKASQILLGVTVFFFILWIGQDIIIPLVFAGMISVLLNPVVNRLTRWKLPRVAGITLSIIIAMFLILCLMYFFVSQASLFSESFPDIKQKGIQSFKDAELWVAHTFNVPKGKVDAWVNKTQKDGMASGGSMIGQTLGTIGSLMITFFIMPVYCFMMLYYKPLLLEFFAKLFPKEYHATVFDVLTKSKGLIQNYLIGLLVEAALVAALNSAALMIIGLKYAILIGVIGALLNVIPYIGGLVAVAIPMLLALATMEPVSALYVLIAYIVVQFIDNNFFVPKIVASKVKINALVSIIVVLVGDAIWGVPGMFLSIPLTAIVKVIFDRIPPLEPFGFLLGDNLPDFTQQFFSIRKGRARSTAVKKE